MKNIPNDKRIEELAKYLVETDGLKSQAEGITHIKKSKARGNIGIALVLIILGGLALIYGIADVFSDKALPMGTLFLIGGGIMVVGGLYMVLSSIGKAATASHVVFESNLEKLCKTFYTSAFCKKTTDFVNKEDQIIDVCQCIPVPVLEKYEKTGWGELATRWMKLRTDKVKEDVDFVLKSLHVDQSPHSDPRIVDIIVQLRGEPFGSLSLSNVALNIGGKWFLSSPEPITTKDFSKHNNDKHDDNQAIEEPEGENQVHVANERLYFSIGIETIGDVFTTLIKSGTKLPCEHREIFTTAQDNQKEVEIHVLKGFSSRASECESLGKFILSGIPKAGRGKPQIEVAFHIPSNSEFILNARDLASGAEVAVIQA